MHAQLLLYNRSTQHPYLVVAMFDELLDAAKIYLHLGCNQRHVRRAQNQVDEQVWRLVLLCRQVVLESPVAFAHIEGRHDGVCRVRKRIAVRCLDFGSQCVSDLRCNWPLTCVAFGSILVEFNQRPLEPLHRRNADRERFRVVRRFRVTVFEVGAGGGAATTSFENIPPTQLRCIAGAWCRRSDQAPGACFLQDSRSAMPALCQTYSCPLEEDPNEGKLHISRKFSEPVASESHKLRISLTSAQSCYSACGRRN